MGHLSVEDTLKVLELEGLNPSFTTGTNWAPLGKNPRKEVVSPINGKTIAAVEWATKLDYEHILPKSLQAFEIWRLVPAPQRGEIVRQIGNELRKNKEALGALVSYEMGKIYQEGLGEVQEMIDICDFATGLSRQLYGLTMHSERAEHRMYEQYHPLGIVGIISAFNFPVAVWAWNAMLAAVCGDVCIWKPSEKTPLTAIACHKIIGKVLKENNIPEGVFSLIIGNSEIGSLLANDERIPLISATGSVRMGKIVASQVAARLGKSLLELGGNNALIISENANIDMAIRAIMFGAVGTCGQRCTTTRRLIVHESHYNLVIEKLIKLYQQLPIGNPMEDGILVGPLIDKEAVQQFVESIKKVQEEGGKLRFGGVILKDGKFENGNYVLPALVEAKNDFPTVQKETFAPILYIMAYSGSIDNAIKMQNAVKQGLSSALFTNSFQESESFLSSNGSDCGIANINIGTSGAEIGGAFGGEKETGGGRESGSDAWKIYMRRQTNTLNFGSKMPLAQGIKFNFD